MNRDKNESSNSNPVWEISKSPVVFRTPLGEFEAENMQIMTPIWLEKTGREMTAKIVRPESSMLAKLLQAEDYLLDIQPSFSGFEVGYLKDLLGLKLSDLRMMSTCKEARWSQIINECINIGSNESFIKVFFPALIEHIKLKICELRDVFRLEQTPRIQDKIAAEIRRDFCEFESFCDSFNSLYEYTSRVKTLVKKRDSKTSVFIESDLNSSSEVA